jgi:hypothetical protein
MPPWPTNPLATPFFIILLGMLGATCTVWANLTHLLSRARPQVTTRISERRVATSVVTIPQVRCNRLGHYNKLDGVLPECTYRVLS